MKKIIKLTHIHIMLWEKRGRFFKENYITDEKMSWDKKEITLLNVLLILEKKKKLPQNFLEIRRAMANSHNNMSDGFRFKKPWVEVLDLDTTLYQLVG